ncbi:hypothetical protein Sste5344_006274, partial [Sporothrix stenoceras]
MNWANKARKRWVQDGWFSNQEFSSWEEKQAYQEPRKDQWPGVIYEIDLTTLPRAEQPAIFESVKLQALLNVECGERGDYLFAKHEFLVLHRIPFATIAKTH